MIQWFPGHMNRARREIEENLKLVDIVFELLDARVPMSSRNPLLKQIINQKPKLVLLTKSSLADPVQTKNYISLFNNELETSTLEIDAITGFNINKIVNYSNNILKEKFAREKSKGMKPRAIRAMIVGIPNVGKSTLINKLVGKRVARVGDRPGITKARQWVRINKDLELLDTPGVLWHKFDDEKVGIHLALSGAIKDDILSMDDLGNYLIDFLKANYEVPFKNRYNITDEVTNIEIINKIADARGLFGDDRITNTMKAIINDFRSARIGRITLDRYDFNG